MISSNLLVAALVLAALIVLPLAYYAGTLLYKLKQQNDKQAAVRRSRIAKLQESIQTIAMAVEQQQCNLSEGAIRLTQLLESLPISNPPDWSAKYPALFELYSHVRHLPTHEARKALPRAEREQQDRDREEHEARLESTILKEVADLRHLEV